MAVSPGVSPLANAPAQLLSFAGASAHAVTAPMSSATERVTTRAAILRATSFSLSDGRDHASTLTIAGVMTCSVSEVGGSVSVGREVRRMESSPLVVERSFLFTDVEGSTRLWGV